jgi:ABC-type nitrate/sulfonate/bicarbonate transport system permease component
VVDRAEIEHGAGPGGFRLGELNPFGSDRSRAALIERPVHPAVAFLAHPLTLRFLSALALCLAWEWAGRIPISPAFPTFGETMLGLWAMIADFSLIRAFGITLQPLVIGLVISAALGIAIGVAMGLSDKAEWFASPIFIIAQAAPLAALIPLIVFSYGIGLTAKTLVVCIMAMPVISLNSFAAIRHTPLSMVEMGRSFLASPRQVIQKIILPAASPIIFAGLRLGCAAGFIGAILAELLITPTGIGDLITYHRSIADYPKMYAAILSIMLFSVLFIEVLERIEITLFRPEKRARA